METCSPVEAITSSSARRRRIELLARLSEAVGLARHGGGHDHQFVALVHEARHAPRDLANALRAAHGGAAILLDDQ